MTQREYQWRLDENNAKNISQLELCKLSDFHEITNDANIARWQLKEIVILIVQRAMGRSLEKRRANILGQIKRKSEGEVGGGIISVCMIG